MSKVKTVTNKKSLPEVIECETGEVIQNAYTLESSELVEISYDEYIIMSSDAVQYLKNVLKNHEKAYLMEMFDMLQTPMNMLYNGNNIPHTNKSLQQALNHTNAAFYVLMTKLYKAGIIWYLTGYRGDKKIKQIIINPHIARKRKIFDKRILALFSDIKTLNTNIV